MPNIFNYTKFRPGSSFSTQSPRCVENEDPLKITWKRLETASCIIKRFPYFSWDYVEILSHACPWFFKWNAKDVSQVRVSRRFHIIQTVRTFFVSGHNVTPFLFEILTSVKDIFWLWKKYSYIYLLWRTLGHLPWDNQGYFSIQNLLTQISCTHSTRIVLVLKLIFHSTTLFA